MDARKGGGGGKNRWSTSPLEHQKRRSHSIITPVTISLLFKKNTECFQ